MCFAIGAKHTEGVDASLGCKYDFESRGIVAVYRVAGNAAENEMDAHALALSLAHCIAWHPPPHHERRRVSPNKQVGLGLCSLTGWEVPSAMRRGALGQLSVELVLKVHSKWFRSAGADWCPGSFVTRAKGS